MPQSVTRTTSLFTCTRSVMPSPSSAVGTKNLAPRWASPPAIGLGSAYSATMNHFVKAVIVARPVPPFVMRRNPSWWRRAA